MLLHNIISSKYNVKTFLIYIAGYRYDWAIASSSNLPASTAV